LNQFAPVDTPTAVGAFLDHWTPNAIVLIESELWPNLIMSASENGVSHSFLIGSPLSYFVKELI
jgi:3-deoxy-D-manno-octulosonic-acid transferase